MGTVNDGYGTAHPGEVLHVLGSIGDRSLSSDTLSTGFCVEGCKYVPGPVR